MMNVKSLIEELSKLDPQAEVILQKDGEGNGYSPLSEVDPDCIYVPESTWAGEVYSTTWTYEEASYDSDKEWKKFKKDNRKCVVLAPVN